MTVLVSVLAKVKAALELIYYYYPHLRRRRRRRRRLFPKARPKPAAGAGAAINIALVLLVIINNITPMTTVVSSSTSTSRAYPLGCLHRHPSYYTYDERDDNNIPVTSSSSSSSFDSSIPSNALPPTTPTAVTVDETNNNNQVVVGSPTIFGALIIDHIDFRTLPKKSSKLRHNYSQYRIIRQLGSGKFSEVFEAVDVKRREAWKKLRRRQERRRKQQQQRRRREQQQERVADVQSRRHVDDDDDDDDDDETTRMKTRRKKVNTVGMTSTDESDEEDDDENTEPFINGNGESRRKHEILGLNNNNNINESIVVLKCLKPISERKIRRELLVLTHCNTLPNVARLIGIILPESMDENDDVNNESKNEEERKKRDDNASQNEGEKRIVKDQSSSISTSSTTTQIDGRNNGKGTDKKKFGMRNNHQQQQQHVQQLPALILEHAGLHSQWLCHNAPQLQQQQQQRQQLDQLPGYLTEHEIKYYLCHLLVALDGLHSAGIMHRDVKPRNMLINRRSLPSRQQHDTHGNNCDDMYLSNSETDDCERSSNDNEDESSAQHFSHQSPPLPPIPLMLVDLGLADFYHPGKSYNVRVASRHYKSPELLIGYDKYDYSIDLWAVGCILAGLLFRKEPFFRGKDNDDQLGRIVSVLGMQDFLRYRRKCGVRLSAGARAAIGKYCWTATMTSTSSSSSPLSCTTSSLSLSASSSEDDDVQSVLDSGMRYRKPWLTFLSPNCPTPSPAGLDLLDKLLVYDHEQRWTAREALNHEFFDDVRDQVWEETRKRMEWESRRRTTNQS